MLYTINQKYYAQSQILINMIKLKIKFIRVLYVKSSIYQLKQNPYFIQKRAKPRHIWPKIHKGSIVQGRLRRSSHYIIFFVANPHHVLKA